MRTRKVDNSVERRIVTGMCVSDEFLQRVRAIYDPDLMAVPFARTVADWCTAYFLEYGCAPGRHVQDIFEREERNGLAKDQAALIADFLAEASEEYERGAEGKFNVNYLLDQAEARFAQQKLRLLAADVEALVDKGDVKAAELLVSGHRRVERPASAGLEPLVDADAVQRAFEGRQDAVLFTFPGALGQLLAPVMRHDFIGVMGPEKRGKSFQLLDLAMRAVRARCNVAYFDCGDSPEDEHVVRVHMYNTGRSPDIEGRIKLPVFDCENNQRAECPNGRTCEGSGARGTTIMTTVRNGSQEKQRRLSLEEWERQGKGEEWVPCTRCVREKGSSYRPAVWHQWSKPLERLTWQEAVEAGKRTAAQSRKRFKLSCHSSGTLSVSASEVILDQWEREEGFVPDVIIYDYPDIMAPEPLDERKEARHQTNGIWMAQRRVSLSRHCAVIAATQSDADSYDQRSLKEKNFSEDKRKYAHVTRMVVLNQTPEEKADGVIRLSQMFVRSRHYNSKKQVIVLRCLEIGRPYMGSY